MAEFLHIKTEDGEVYMVNLDQVHHVHENPNTNRVYVRMVNRGVAEDLTCVIGEAQRREIMKFFEWKCLNRDF
ncbi:hypothetical protein [Bremerella sp.]|uniref:hypothetical protein n=1 Tax=Bremerella sp. TaxID=2795602 RepID=UPI0039193876